MKESVKRKIAFLTEGGKGIGFGHIGRCLPIAKAFEQLGHTVTFFVHGDESVVRFLSSSNLQVIDWVIEYEAIQLKLKEFDLLVLDSLRVPLDVYKKISLLPNRLGVIDDIGLRPYQEQEFVINWLISNKAEKVHHGEYTELRGPQYVPLRPTFAKRRTAKELKALQRIVVTLGGSDVRNLTIPIIDQLLTNFPTLEVCTFVTPNFENLASFEKYAKNPKVQIFYSPSEEQIIEVFRKSDVAICTGGHTVYELACCGTPTLLFLVVENQQVSSSWADTGFVSYLGWYDTPNFMNNLMHAFSSLKPIEKRRTMAEQGQKRVDGLGAERVAKVLLNSID